ncbi:MAG: DNA repair protein RecO [Bacilli bacterium]|nr:DNA repair protein RecO [Bacilli bacterium]
MISKELENDVAIVLLATKYQDDSAIIKLAGKEGIFSLIAKGVYKPKSSLKALLITGNLLEIDYKKSDSGPSFAHSCRVILDASSAYQDYQSSCFLLFLQELTNALFEYGERLPYEELLLIIRSLCEKKDVLSLALLLVGTFYRRLGINMSIDECVKCQRSDNIVSYSLQEGGLLCKDCLGQEKVKNHLEIHVFRYAFMEVNEKNVNRIVPPAEGFKVLNELVLYLMDYFDLKKLQSFAMFVNALSVK